LVVCIGAALLVSTYQLYQSKARLAPQISRLQGLAAAEQDIAQAVKTSSDQLAQLAYMTKTDSGVLGNNMQQSMRELFAQAGLTVSGSQVLPVVEQDSFTRIRIRLTAKGEMSALTEVLELLQMQRRVVVIDTLELKPKTRRRRNDNEQELQVSAVLSSFAQISD
jgi:general secretion pathway protein M